MAQVAGCTTYDSTLDTLWDLSVPIELVPQLAQIDNVLDVVPGFHAPIHMLCRMCPQLLPFTIQYSS